MERETAQILWMAAADTVSGNPKTESLAAPAYRSVLGCNHHLMLVSSCNVHPGKHVFVHTDGMLSPANSFRTHEMLQRSFSRADQPENGELGRQTHCLLGNGEVEDICLVNWQSADLGPAHWIWLEHVGRQLRRNTDDDRWSL